MRLLTSGGLPLAGGIIGMSVQITWLKPVRPGDVLRVVSTVQDIKRSNSKRQGVATVMSETQDKFGGVAQRLLSKLLVTAREAETSSNRSQRPPSASISFPDKPSHASSTSAVCAPTLATLDQGLCLAAAIPATRKPELCSATGVTATGRQFSLVHIQASHRWTLSDVKRPLERQLDGVSECLQIAELSRPSCPCNRGAS
jgi:hypothetical protein